jgi:hypothetical protein
MHTNMNIHTSQGARYAVNTVKEALTFLERLLISSLCCAAWPLTYLRATVSSETAVTVYTTWERVTYQKKLVNVSVWLWEGQIWHYELYCIYNITCCRELPQHKVSCTHYKRCLLIMDLNLTFILCNINIKIMQQ